MKILLIYIRMAIRVLRNKLMLLGKSSFLKVADCVHFGPAVRLWAPHHINIGRCVYIGKGAHIETNATIGDYCLIANDVSIVGRHDHDFSIPGIPMKFTPWILDMDKSNPLFSEEARIESDVWLGYRSTILSGTKIGRGAVVAAGSVVVKDVQPYDIVAGVPARHVGRRFTDEQIIEHERKIKNGKFYVSEKGLSYCVIKPGK